MFVKVEDEKKVILAPEESPEAECVCICGVPTQETKETVLPVNKTGNALSLYYEING